MNRFLTILLSLSCFSVAFGQNTYWQQELNYHIKVSLDDQTNQLTGNLGLTYINHSPDTLNFIWFHLWPNGYKNDSTALGKQLKASDSKKILNNREQGFITQLQFTVDGADIKTEIHPEFIDVVKLVLRTPLLPGKQILIQTPFTVKLPNYYSRSGYSGQQYMICQWYPKPAVYDRKGWHPFPYLDQGEFYSDYGNYTVEITLPSKYIVGASGKLNTREEYNAYTSIGAENYKSKGKGKPKMYQPLSAAATKTLVYNAEMVHDFAWFADNNFIIQYDTLQLPSGKIVDAFTYAQPDGNREWKKSVDFVEDAVRKYSDWIGEYPYPTVQAVEGPKNNSSGGMEYPMITLITSPDANEETLDGVITHEVGHNWFYGILGSNERDNPWMDEGLNTFYQFRYEAEKYKGNSIFGKSIPKSIKALPSDEFLARIYNGLNSIPASAPIQTGSTGFANSEDYGVVVYLKTAIWFFLVEKQLGRPVLDKAMHDYFSAWKFKHPYPEDFKETLEKSSGINLDTVFSLLSKEGNF